MKRFSLGWFGKEDTNGAYVKYEDAKKLSAKRLRLEEEIAHLDVGIRYIMAKEDGIIQSSLAFNSLSGRIRYELELTNKDFLLFFEREKAKLTAELEAL